MSQNREEHALDSLEGIKFDQDKLDWRLLPWAQLEETVKVLMHGAEKYAIDNWKKVSRERYENALMRHAVSYMSGEKIDPESGMNHLSHIMCNALFLKWNDDKK
jgi:hypothetical protein